VELDSKSSQPDSSKEDPLYSSVSNGKEETGEQPGRRTEESKEDVKGKKDKKEMERDGKEDSYHLYSSLSMSRAERVPLPSDRPCGYSELVSTLIKTVELCITWEMIRS